MLWISLALHALAIAALFIAPTPTPPQDGLGPPSVSIVLAPDNNPANPAPTPQAAIGAPDAQTVQRAAPPDALAPLPPSAAEQAQPEPVERPTPPLAFAPQAVPTPAPAPPPPSPPAPPPTPAAPISVAPAPDADLPVPPVPPNAVPPSAAPPQATAAVPPTVREALVQSPQVRPPQRPQPAARPAPTPRRNAPSGFPMPMFSSLGGALPQSREAARAPSREMAGPVRTGSSASRLSGDVGGDDLGPGWERALKEWVDERKHYPDQAAENGDDGDVVVNLVIARDGRVKA